MSRTASTAARRIARAWGLSDLEMAPLLGITQADVPLFYEQADSELTPAIRERIACLIMIWEKLATVFGNGPMADGWMRRPNRDFGDRAPLERMMNGEVNDLERVRLYLSMLD